MKNRKITEILTATRLNKISLNKNAVSLICKILKEKLQIKNAALAYQFVNLFNLSSIKNSTLSYIQRLFTIVSDEKSFLELEHNFFSKIIASSELLITSEIEVLKVASRWLNHDIEERSKYADDILLKVRLHLLSTETIRHLLYDSTYFKKHDSCVKTLNEMLDCREKKSYKSSSIYHASRYCNQKYFKLLVLGGNNSKTYESCNNVSCIDLNNLENVEAYPPLKTARKAQEVVYVKGYLYAFGGRTNNDYIKTVDKYSLTSKTWSKVADMTDNRKYFCICAFIDKIFVVGGSMNKNKTRFSNLIQMMEINSSLQFDTSDYSWKEVAKMNEARSKAACAVYEEKIVVSGGLSNNRGVLNSVESYDVLPNKWSTMPKMNSGKCNHSLVVVKNKLFVISMKKDYCEVFDNVCKKFIIIKSPEFNYLSIIRAYCFESKIFALQKTSSKIFSYETNKNEWSKESYKFTKNLQFFSSVKVPCL